jgi:hypothetical protein
MDFNLQQLAYVATITSAVVGGLLALRTFGWL